MQKPEELVEKITKEEQELDIKLTDLECFMMSADFIKVSLEQKTLLEQQHKVMTEYKLILIKRAHRINWEAGRDKAAAEIKEAIIADPNEREHGCAGCRHAEYHPEDKGKPTCGNPRADGKTCWEAKEPELPLCPFKDGNTIPKCINLRGDKCSSPNTLCYRSARIPKKEEEDGTPSNQ